MYHTHSLLNLVDVLFVLHDRTSLTGGGVCALVDSKYTSVQNKTKSDIEL